jgi:NADPH-dependent curcumin reductase CurA
MLGSAICRVLASQNKSASAGDIVTGSTGWKKYAVLSEGLFEPAAKYPNLQRSTDMLSVLGLTGLTAWWGMTKIGEPKEGETVVVSGAAGATGSVAGQIAKLKGARVIGICGSEEKCRWLTQVLGFDLALNYKEPDFKKKLREATPKYIDVYFDNGNFHIRLLI